MARSDLVREAEESAQSSARLRERFGIATGTKDEADVRDWLGGTGSVPATVACAAVALYLVAFLFSALG